MAINSHLTLELSMMTQSFNLLSADKSAGICSYSNKFFNSWMSLGWLLTWIWFWITVSSYSILLPRGRIGFNPLSFTSPSVWFAKESSLTYFPSDSLNLKNKSAVFCDFSEEQETCPTMGCSFGLGGLWSTQQWNDIFCLLTKMTWSWISSTRLQILCYRKVTILNRT